jgi:hypothetical protein
VAQVVHHRHQRVVHGGRRAGTLHPAELGLGFWTGNGERGGENMESRCPPSAPIFFLVLTATVLCLLATSRQ